MSQQHDIAMMVAGLIRAEQQVHLRADPVVAAGAAGEPAVCGREHRAEAAPAPAADGGGPRARGLRRRPCPYIGTLWLSGCIVVLFLVCAWIAVLVLTAETSPPQVVPGLYGNDTATAAEHALQDGRLLAKLDEGVFVIAPHRAFLYIYFEVYTLKYQNIGHSHG